MGNASFNAYIDNVMTTSIILPMSTYLWEPTEFTASPMALLQSNGARFCSALSSAAPFIPSLSAHFCNQICTVICGICMC